MKVIVAYKSGNCQDGTGLNIMVWPDSAMIKSGKPLFIPRRDMMFHPGLVAKIKSVGKSIKDKFASRYYDEIAPAAFFFSGKVSAAITKKEDPLACDIISDYSIICGDFMPSEAEDSLESPLKLEIGIKPLSDEGQVLSKELKIDNPKELLDKAISAASVNNTLKTGDLAGFILTDDFKAVPDSLLKIKTDGKILIENKLK